MSWKTKSNRSISTMEDRIPKWFQHCHKVCCKKGGHCRRWALIVGKECTVEMCFLDEWTWHMIVKYNSLYEVKHHRNIVWYCKANFKTNLSRLEIRSRKSYSYSFKCINCKGEHQADSNLNTLKYGRMMSITQKNIF